MASPHISDEPARTPHERALKKNIQYISRQLEHCVDDMATSAFARGLISRKTRSEILNRVANRVSVSSDIRAQIMVDVLLEKMEEGPGDAKIIMDYFIEEALDEHPNLQAHLRRELVNFGNEPNPQIFVFIRNSDTIGNMLRIGTTLGDIANKLRKYLSDAQFSNIANASSQHAHICMTIMLDEIKAKIRADPKNWRVFIDEVLGKIEPAQFTAGLIAKLEKDLKDIEDDKGIDLPRVPGQLKTAEN